MELTHIDLFSGIGGFALAARWCGLKTVQFVEMDGFCQKVLQKNFPGVPIHDDIKTFTFTNSTDGGSKAGNSFHEGWATGKDRGTSIQENADRGDGIAITDDQPTAFDGHAERNRPFILTAGVPCQPASCAGKRRGVSDDRWLWDEAIRVLAEVKPTWAIFENVAGLLSLESGVVFDNLLSQVEAEGYEVQAFVIPACAVNAPHRRDRVWIVAHTSTTGAGSVGGTPYDQRWRTDEGRGEGIRHGNGEARTGGAKSADCHAADSDRFNGDDAGLDPSKVSQLKKAEIFRMQSSADTSNEGLQRREWLRSYEQGQAAYGSTPERNHTWDEPWIEAATRLCRVDDGVSRGLVKDRVNRLKALGNSIVPQVAYYIIKSILEVEKSK
jgi:DNA (cytosine-5)-methyltransferase 1